MTAVAAAAPPKHVAWVGVFRATGELAPSDTRTVVGRPGEVVVLTPSAGAPPPAGDVAVVQPLVGMNVIAHVDHGLVIARDEVADRAHVRTRVTRGATQQAIVGNVVAADQDTGCHRAEPDEQ